MELDDVHGIRIWSYKYSFKMNGRECFLYREDGNIVMEIPNWDVVLERSLFISGIVVEQYRHNKFVHIKHMKDLDRFMGFMDVFYKRRKYVDIEWLYERDMYVEFFG